MSGRILPESRLGQTSMGYANTLFHVPDPVIDGTSLCIP